MKKYKGYYFTTKRTKDGYVWQIRNKEREVLQTSEDYFLDKGECEFDCLDHIDEYYY